MGKGSRYLGMRHMSLFQSGVLLISVEVSAATVSVYRSDTKSYN